ncbi:MAG: hypothetical protein CM15mV11_1870 [Caudoviricetes sp.]|nr:MAG: hypothetical protein CM15mV11_1870 [Caudoviricetes sp.]
MTYPATDDTPHYDWWFDNDIPKAKYGHYNVGFIMKMQAWIQDSDLTIHNAMYTMAGLNLAIIGGGSSGVW